jgi:hypothetical protein
VDVDWTCNSCPKVSGKIKKKGKHYSKFMLQSEFQIMAMRELSWYSDRTLLLGQYFTLDQRNERTESMTCHRIVTGRMSRGSLFSICNTLYCFVIKQNALNAVFCSHPQQCYHPSMFFLLFFILYFYFAMRTIFSVRWNTRFARDMKYQKQPLTLSVLHSRKFQSRS